MIKLPNLDDQVFEDIVETARRRAVQYCPEWTNFNPSDPGLTLLELFAWLKEMQQYRLNRITREGVLSCLNLLGMSPKGAQSAKTVTVFKSDKPREIPEATPFTTQEGMVFETTEPVTIGDGSVFSVWTETGGEQSKINEISADGEDIRLSVQPFGPDEKEGSCLYIGFFGVKGKKLRLYFDIDDKYPVARTPFGEETKPSRDIAWEFGPEFDKAAKCEDMTRGFSVSGEITIDIPDGWESSKPDPAMPKCRWLRARLTGKGAEESPKINKFFKDFTTLHQVETLSRTVEIESREKNISLTDYLGISGEHIIFTPKNDGWKHIRLADSRIERTESATHVKTNADGKHRIVSIKPGFSAMLSTKTNLPGIRLEVPAQGYFERISLMIEDGGIWYDWEYTDALHRASPYDRVFTTDGESVVFGDNEHGACPPAGTGNVLISCCRTTLGKDGNVLPHVLTDASLRPLSRNPLNDNVKAEDAGYSADNITYGEGGRNPESIEQALTRVVRHLSATDRCVTCKDFEKIAAATPGTRIIKTRAAEGFDAKTGASGVPALVTVVVQPYGTSDLPLPDKRMLERVAAHLEKGRLLTTRVEVVAPEYVPVSVNVSAAVTDSEAARTSVKEKLLELLSPVKGKIGIGASVLVADVTAAISSCAGVSRILSVTLSAPENMAPIDRSGNIALPPHKIAYPGEIDVSIGN